MKRRPTLPRVLALSHRAAKLEGFPSDSDVGIIRMQKKEQNQCNRSYEICMMICEPCTRDIYSDPAKPRGAR